LAAALEAARPGDGGVQGVYSRDSAGLGSPAAYKHGQQLENIYGMRAGPVPVLGTALALVRRERFFAAGGFVQGLRSATLEDRLLGARLHADGTPMRLEPAFRGRHRHDYALGELLSSDFARARDEILHWRDLGAARGYVHPRKGAGYAAFLVGAGLCAAGQPAPGLGLIAGTIAVDLVATARAARRCDWSWPLISALDHAAVVAGACTGALRAAGGGR
jgi:hypothetical protein